MSRESPRRKLLMMCYFYPPVLAAGTQRSVAFATRLRASGWEPLILTVRQSRNRWEASGEPEPPGITVVRTAEWDLQGLVLFLYGGIQRVLRTIGRKLRRNHFYDWCFPDFQIAWSSTWKGRQLARDADCIYASCSPFSSALSAVWVKKLTGKPLVLDFRDAWSLNPHRRVPAYVQRWTRRAERWALRHCDALVLNTDGARQLYAAAYPEHLSKLVTIPNGFAGLNLPDAGAARPDRFTIMHVGDFYGARQPDLLLEAIAELNEPRVEFVQVGAPFPGEARFRDRIPMRRIEKVSNAEALQLMQQASLLYLKQGWEPGVTGYIAIASKTYEYISTGLPILSDCPPGDNRDLVSRYAAAPYTLMEQTRDAMLDLLRRAIQAPHAPPSVTDAFIETFGRDRLAQRLAAVLDAVVTPGRRPADVQAASTQPSAAARAAGAPEGSAHA